MEHKRQTPDGLLRLQLSGGRRMYEHPFDSKKKWRIIVPQSYREVAINLVHIITKSHLGD